MKTDPVKGLLAQAWKKAYASGEETLTFASKAQCMQMRTMLYNFRKEVLANPVRFDPATVEAIEACMISRQGERELLIRKRIDTPEMQALIAQLNLRPDQEVGKSPEDLELEASAQRLREKLGDTSALPETVANKVNGYR